MQHPDGASKFDLGNADGLVRTGSDGSPSAASEPQLDQRKLGEESPGESKAGAFGSDATGSDSTGSDATDLGPAELIARHQRGVWRYLRMLGCDSSTADDLTQETFLRVLRRDNFVQHSEAATSSYLRRTAYNLLVSDHRKQKRVQTVAESPIIDEIWDRWAGKDLAGDVAIEALKECFSTLSDRAKMALKMRFGSDASRVEIAEALKITEHGARNLMQRAKAQVRDCVQARLKTINL